MVLGGEPSTEVHHDNALLSLDPLDFVPSDTAFACADDGGVFSFWAPSFTADRDVELGLFLNGFVRGRLVAKERAAALRDLADAISGIPV